MRARRCTRLASFLALALLCVAAVPVAAEPTSYPELMRSAANVLRPRRGGPGRVAAERVRRSLADLPRDDLTDGEWIDLHVVLAALDRRLDPIPRYAGEAIAPREVLDAIPDGAELAEGRDPLTLLAAARGLRRCRAKPGTPPPDRKAMNVLDEAVDRARRLAAALRPTAGAEDPLLAAAATVLAEEAEDLAFDLSCRAEGRVAAGRDRFLWILARRHGMPLTVERTRALGAEARRNALREIRAYARSLGGDWIELTEKGREERPSDADALLSLCREATEAAHRAARESGLVSVPEYVAPPRVNFQPDRYSIPYACYHPGRIDRTGRYRGVVSITRPDEMADPLATAWFRDRDVHWIRVVCGHEAVPGHHLQHAVAAQVGSPYRHFGRNTPYIEGWGLYSEELLERAGYYEDPLTRLAWLRMRLWRAVRVLIDVGLHNGEFTPSEAVRMLVTEVLLERTSAEKEVKRYLSTPAQPLSYMLGFRRIRALRRAWLARHGPTAEREFHDRLLGLGCIPLDLAAAVLLGKRRGYDLTHPPRPLAGSAAD